jgi:putative endonuclease
VLPFPKTEPISCDNQHSNAFLNLSSCFLMRHFYVYIMASKSRVLYTGVTNNIRRRVWEHKNDELPGFTLKYRVHRLVYFGRFQYVGNAIAREKAIKGWLRRKKIALVETENPT